MNATSLPSFNFRNLVSEKEKARSKDDENFEVNHTPFANTVAFNFAHIVLTKFGDFMKNQNNYVVPSESNKKSYYLECDMTNIRDRGPDHLNMSISHAVKGSPFKDWSEKSSKDSNFYGNSKEYFQEKMERIAFIVEQKLNELLLDYTSNPTCDNLKFNVTFEKEKITIILDLWFDLAPKSLPVSNEITQSKKGIHITALKKASVQDDQKTAGNSFDDPFADF